VGLALETTLSTTSSSTQSGPPPGGRNPQEPPTPPAQEFRSYRRFLASAVLVFICVGSTYLLASVGISIYRQRHPMLRGEPVSMQMTHEELLQCWRDLSEVSTDLLER